MSEDHLLEERIRNVLESKGIAFESKRMFGGICFMVDDKMCLGTYKGGIMARVDPNQIEGYCQKPGASQMIHGGRPMTGYLTLAPEAWDLDDDLNYWVQECLNFNPKAKSSKKKK